MNKKNILSKIKALLPYVKDFSVRFLNILKRYAPQIGREFLGALVDIFKILLSILYFIAHYLKLGFKKIAKFVGNKKFTLLKTIAYTGFIGLMLIGFLFVYYSKDLPSSEAISDIFIPESTKILDRTESTVLYDIYGEEKRTIIPPEEIPDSIKWATIVAEDENFYEHPGIDVKGIFRAVVVNIRTGDRTQGGSTITQQFIKNALLTPQKTFSRKIKEAILAIQIEFKYSKDEILDLYLNQVPYGGNTYGVEAASKSYFNKSAKDLTLAEATTLAALPQAPTYYANNQEALKNRQRFILEKMKNSEYISEEEYELALNEEVILSPTFSGFDAPHFVIEVKKYLENKYGATFVQKAGLKVVTTLDTTIQRVAEDSVIEYSEKNKNQFNSNNTAVVVIDPHTGQVLSMVGSKNYFGDSYPENCTPGKSCLFDPQVNVAVTPQQPGSSFKPFAYAAAYDRGYTPDTIIYDTRTEFNPNCSANALEETAPNGSKCYNPGNYDLAYFGPLTFKEALAQSRNIPAVKVLYLAGIENTLKLANRMGIDSLQDHNRYGLALVLGGGDVTLVEETSAFGVFATEGERNETTFILNIEDKEGNVLEEYRKNSVRVLDKNVANQVTYSLSKNEFRSRVFGEVNNLNIPGLSVAAKTGTTQDYMDAWTVGYTPSITVGVWTGNNNNYPMRNGSGSSVASPIWNSVIKNIYKEKSLEGDIIKNKEFYFKLPTLEEESSFTNPVIDKTEKPVLDGVVMPHSILHYVEKYKPRKDAPDNPKNDPQYTNWDYSVRIWARENGILNDSNGNNEQSGPIVININNPENKNYKESEDIIISGSVSSSGSLKNIRITLNKNTVLNKRFSNDGISAYNIQNNLGSLSEGNYTITIFGETYEENTTSRSVSFIVGKPNPPEENEDALNILSL
ncbi:MAG: transglycosylase domain-containing protein [Candidatus Spechtbacterales bacterium]|nr:transglycosylase domain-containing protein [Candidatus Spechtbacterales bacterium]